MSVTRKMREAIEAKEVITVRLLNQRKNGQPFCSIIRMEPLISTSGELVRIVGVQCEVSAGVPQAVISREMHSAVGTLTLHEVVSQSLSHGFALGSGAGTAAFVSEEQRKQHMLQCVTAMIQDACRGVDWDSVVRFFVASRRVDNNKTPSAKRVRHKRKRARHPKVMRAPPCFAVQDAPAVPRYYGGGDEDVAKTLAAARSRHATEQSERLHGMLHGMIKGHQHRMAMKGTQEGAQQPRLDPQGGQFPAVLLSDKSWA